MTRRLDDTYKLVLSQIDVLKTTRRAALRPGVSTDYLTQLGIPEFGTAGTKTERRRTILAMWFDSLEKQSRRLGFIDLVATFEAEVFRRIEQSASNTRHLLNSHYPSASPFHHYRHNLPRTSEDYRSLAGLRRVFWRGEATLDAEHVAALRAIIAQRDYLAHGERWEPLAVPPTVETAYPVLKRELGRIDGGEVE